MSERRRDLLGASLHASAEAHLALAADGIDPLVAVVDAVVDVIGAGGKILLFGNGGSAAQAQHVAAELVGRLGPDRESRPWPAVALTTDSSVLTALANDYSFADVMARQVEALARPGDLVVGMSTSGRSTNVLNGLAAARRLGTKTVAFTGQDPGPLAEVCDVVFLAPASATPRVQEVHLSAWHAICEVVEQELATGAGEAPHPP